MSDLIVFGSLETQDSMGHFLLETLHSPNFPSNPIFNHFSWTALLILHKTLDLMGNLSFPTLSLFLGDALGVFVFRNTVSQLLIQILVPQLCSVLSGHIKSSTVTEFIIFL